MIIGALWRFFMTWILSSSFSLSLSSSRYKTIRIDPQLLFCQLHSDDDERNVNIFVCDITWWDGWQAKQLNKQCKTIANRYQLELLVLFIGCVCAVTSGKCFQFCFGSNLLFFSCLQTIKPNSFKFCIHLWFPLSLHALKGKLSIPTKHTQAKVWAEKEISITSSREKLLILTLKYIFEFSSFFLGHNGGYFEGCSKQLCSLPLSFFFPFFFVFFSLSKQNSGWVTNDSLLLFRVN